MRAQRLAGSNGRRPREDKDRDWSDESTSQEMTKIAPNTRRWERQEGPPLEHLKEGWP